MNISVKVFLSGTLREEEGYWLYVGVSVNRGKLGLGVAAIKEAAAAGTGIHESSAELNLLIKKEMGRLAILE